MQRGTIVRLLPERGFGFLKSGDGADYFFHYSAVIGVRLHALRLGEQVTFTTEDSARGLRAGRVQRLED